MNSAEDFNKRQNMPVFFTGLTESITNQPKVPLLCILCGSSLAKSNSSNNNQNSFSGCENCTKNFDNLKKALDLLSKLPPAVSVSPVPSSGAPSSQSNNINSSEVKRKSLLPFPVLASTSDETNFIPEDKPSDYRRDRFYKRERKDSTCSPNNDLKRKKNFRNSTSKKLRSENFPPENNLKSTADVYADELSKSIWDLFIKNKQTDEVYSKKMALRDKLHEILLTRFPSCGLYVVGSSMTGLGGNSSDMDMCLMLTDAEIDQEKEATNILHIVHSLFLNYSFLTDVQVIYAKVPILRFVDSISGIEVDLNINNAVGIRNTQLLSSYARIDKRLPPLVLLAKMWARHYGINDAKNNTLSSYSLVLMVIHYLQYGCEPPVLPCLQELQPGKYQPHSDVRKLKLFEDLPDFVSENKTPLGDLFIGFLEYFSHEYDYFRTVMSVRLGCVLPKETAMNNTFSPKNKKAHWKYVCIEEPFDLTNTACAVFKPAVFRYMRQVFENSLHSLRRSANLKSILS